MRISDWSSDVCSSDLKNVDWRLFSRLVIPGVIGGILGAYVLTQVHADVARPVVLAYLTAIGLYLLWRGIKYPPTDRKPKVIEPLGLVGGLDRKSVVEGKSVSVRVDIGGRRILKKKKTKHQS